MTMELWPLCPAGCGNFGCAAGFAGFDPWSCGFWAVESRLVEAFGELAAEFNFGTEAWFAELKLQICAQTWGLDPADFGFQTCDQACAF